MESVDLETGGSHHETDADGSIIGVPPLAIEFTQMLKYRLARKMHDRGRDYVPRTRHVDPLGRALYTNRLFLESSPYLLQHAHNPVNWYPWGEEAFAHARESNRPVLVSIGYSTCHWCHVMEEESFEDEEIARFLNDHFVAVKVDREERPDVDAVYMSVVQALTGGGGWPLNVFLTPDKIPFYGGTYSPARDGDRGATTGFISLLSAIRNGFHQNRGRVEDTGQAIVAAINRMNEVFSGTRVPGNEKIKQTVSSFSRQFDPANGGVTGTMKFPSSLPIRLLLRYARRFNDDQARHMAVQTLHKMADGGIHDHAGGGFHRYTVDEKWLIPHFEKMLYDNALLATAYLDGFQATGDPRFERIVRSVLDYVDREMTSPEGGFYSATDADSLSPSGHREEGYYFTWLPEELENVLGPDRARLMGECFDMNGEPHFEGRYILNLPRPLPPIARQEGMSMDALQQTIDDSLIALRNAREKRPRPLRDEKMLTAWNGLMISAFARAGFSLNEPRYTKIAVKAASFVLEKLVTDGRLMRSYHENQARHSGYLDDYAFFIAALLDVYMGTFDITWLEQAVNFQEILIENFADKDEGGFFMTARDHETLIVREKPAMDGATPSGNSVAALNLLRLHTMTQVDKYRQYGEKTLKLFLGSDTVNPAALSDMIIAFDYYMDTPKEIVIVTPEDGSETARPFLDALRRCYLPNAVWGVVTDGTADIMAQKGLAISSGKRTVQGKTTCYVCERGKCDLPVTRIEDFISRIESIA